jgi:succinate dehydrogenase/fumarate reductase flavoprotein subunit
MYEKITADDPYTTPMMIYPAVHYTMGGLWVDYNLESTIPGLFVLGEANFSDHGANRLGASALMQGWPTATSWQANRLADYLELGELMARDALMREESCGGHFRLEHQTEDGEAKRDDKDFMFVSAWEYKGENTEPVMHKEDLEYNDIEVKTRSYK